MWMSIVSLFQQVVAVIKGKIYSSGSDIYGEIGDNSSTNVSSPVQELTSSTNWTTVSAGNYFSGGLKDDGTLWMWGSNQYGQLGSGIIFTYYSSPVQTIAGGTNWKALSAGGYHTTAIKTDNTLWVWGNNIAGELGTNLSGMVTASRSSPVQSIATGTDWSTIEDGLDFSAGIKSDNTLWMWGANNYGQLGDNTSTPKSSPVQTVTGGTNWSTVALGWWHAVAVKTDGTLWVWGYNDNGQLGDTTTTKKSSPIQTVAGGTNWSKVGAGPRHTLAIKTDNRLWVWGANNYGQLGNNEGGSGVTKTSPVQTVSGGTDWSQVAAATDYSYAIKSDGTLWSWGWNNSGQLGDNTTTLRSSPVQTVAGGTNWSLIKQGKGQITGAIKSDNTLWLWGNNNLGQLGDNTTTLKSSPVQTVTGGTNWSTFVMGQDSTIAIKTDNTLWTWGYNDFPGMLGDNTPTNRSSPVQTIAGGTVWSKVAAGRWHVTTIKTNGELWVWGWNQYGQLGTNLAGSRNVSESSPVQTVAGGSNWSVVSSSLRNTGAVKSDGTLWLWGSNFYGQLGNEQSSADRNIGVSSPIQTIAGGTNWKNVAVGYGNSAAVKTDGTLWVWGENFYGQLGNETLDPKSSPIQTIAGGTTWKQASIGYGHIAATKTDGTLWMIGNNGDGQLGIDSTDSVSSPVQTVAGGSNWQLVSVCNNHSGAVKTDGTLWTWGKNNYGQLGDGTTNNRSSPVQTTAGGTTWFNVSAGYTHIAGAKV